MAKENARQPEPTSANEQRHFTGTDNPRHLRVLHMAQRRPMPREELDRTAGCSNGPELIAELRRRGLDFPCHMVPCVDRDGREVQRGIYALSARDRREIARMIAKRDGGAA